MTPATYNYPTHVRGDTIRQRTFTVSLNGSPATISSARMNIRQSNGKLVRSVSLGIASNVVTQQEITDTSDFPVGTLYHDIEITLGSGIIRTYIQGTLVILKDHTFS